MDDITRAERLLSLFTSLDSAAAIAGDLTEQRQPGSKRFWLDVWGTALALWRSVLTEAPLMVLLIVAGGFVLLAGAALGSAAPVFLFPNWLGSAASWSVLSLLWWGAALWIGVSLVAIAPKRGMAACVVLAITGAILLLAFGAGLLWIAGAVPLLMGAAIARRRMLRLSLTALCLLFAVALPAAQETEWKDPSPHKTTFVTVEEGVQLEVLDWGGSGPALVLLAGGGASAHQYDDFAPALTPRHRVVALTRRSHRGSSVAAGGYGFARLAEDVVRVMDAVGVKNPVVIGHSFAGEEMHVLGARYADRIRGLVYVDAAFDRGDDSDSETYGAASKPVPAAPSAQKEDLASFASLRAYLDKYGGAGPEGFLRTRYRTNPDGTIAGIWAPDLPVRQAMLKEMQAAYKPYKPERIRVPALAIYACPQSADDLMRRGSSDRSAFPELVGMTEADAVLRERVEKLFQATQARVRKHEAWFKAFAEQGRIVELAGAHHLFFSSFREVLQHVEAFVASLR
jgi:pimeloyl-ACP methyl ester carboxylesterase